MGKMIGLIRDNFKKIKKHNTFAGFITKLIYNLFRFGLIFGICFIILYPVLNMISMSIKVRDDLFDPSVFWIPRNFSFDTISSNFNFVVKFSEYWNYLFSTLLFVASTTACHIISSCLIGYGFAKFKFRGNSIIFSLVILTMLVPPLTIIIPQYLIMNNFNPLGIIGLFNGGVGVNLNTGFLPIILLGLTGFGLKNSLYIFIFRQFFVNTPKELDEAAYVDGCGIFRTFFYIGVPLAKSAAITVGIFSIVWEWTDTFYTFFFGNNINHLFSELKNLSFRLWMLNADGTHLIYTNVAMLLAILPILILYLVLQKFFTQSIERSGLVG
jgi:multiple sugar transport system permease protein